MIKDYLQKKDKPRDTQLIQGLVPKELVSEVKRIKDECGWSWDEILTAFCKDFTNEFGGEKK
jgi:hypothetical protein